MSRFMAETLGKHKRACEWVGGFIEAYDAYMVDIFSPLSYHLKPGVWI